MMKRFLMMGTVFLLFSNPMVAQIDETILPKTSTLPGALFNKLDDLSLPAFSNSRADELDQVDVKHGKLPKFSRSIPVDYNLYNVGTWTELPDGSAVWRLQVSSDRALGLVPVFERLYLPEGGTLHIYMPDREETIGAFTHANTPEPRGLCAGLVHGETCVIEYYEPAAHRGEGIVQLESVGHAYRWVTPLKRDIQAGESDTCEVNVNCEEGALWQDQKRAVVLILVVDDQGQGYCSGSLINNVKSDCTPYVLSAQHCGEFSVGGDFAQWVFYFNYEAANCSDTTGSKNQFVNGCTKISDSDDQGGEYGSDFFLVRLSQAVPASFNAYLAGWDRSEDVPDSAFCIHHPDSDIKKISNSFTPLEMVSYGGFVDGTHWDVVWDATLNGHGVTEEGSSGAPLFNQRGEIVGTLTGGYSSCEIPFAADQFGRFYFHWELNGDSVFYQLKPWLDPDNTGTLALPGRNASCITGIPQQAKTDYTFEVFPNPSSGLVQLLFDEADTRTIRIIELFGRKISEGVYTQKIARLDLSQLPKGVYLVESASTRGTSVRRMILN